MVEDDSDTITVTVNRACELSGLSRSSIYRLINSGDLQVVKRGGRTLIVYASLRALLLGGSEASAA